MNHLAVMFDLDGTLADTLRDITDAANRMLAALGRPSIEAARCRDLVGQGARWLVEQALATDDTALIDRAEAIFREHYTAGGHALTELYPGVPELLDALTSHGVKLAVLSNKPDALTQHVVADKLNRWRFDAVAGARDGVPLKPDPAAALLLARALNVEPAQWLYVGDSKIDMLTATAAGMFAVGVTWGFRDEAELRDHGAQTIIHKPTTLLDYL